MGTTVRSFDVCLVAVPGESADDTRKRLETILEAAGDAIRANPDKYRVTSFIYGISLKPVRESTGSAKKVNTVARAEDVAVGSGGFLAQVIGNPPFADEPDEPDAPHVVTEVR